MALFEAYRKADAEEVLRDKIADEIVSNLDELGKSPNDPEDYARWFIAVHHNIGEAVRHFVPENPSEWTADQHGINDCFESFNRTYLEAKHHGDA